MKITVNQDVCRIVVNELDAEIPTRDLIKQYETDDRMESIDVYGEEIYVGAQHIKTMMGQVLSLGKQAGLGQSFSVELDITPSKPQETRSSTCIPCQKSKWKPGKPPHPPSPLV